MNSQFNTPGFNTFSATANQSNRLHSDVIIIDITGV